MPERDWSEPIKRGPLKGRVFGSQAEYNEARAQVAEAPEAETAPPADEPTQRRTRAPRGGKVTKEMVYAIVFPLNIGLYLVPVTRPDALNDQEIDRLCDALVKVAAINPYVARAILSGASSTAYVELAMVVGAIAVKRAANHGLIPAAFGDGIGAVMGMAEAPEAPAPVYAPAEHVNGAGPVIGSPGIPDLADLSVAVTG